jgi:hypothetical protein
MINASTVAGTVQKQWDKHTTTSELFLLQVKIKNLKHMQHELILKGNVNLLLQLSPPPPQPIINPQGIWLETAYTVIRFPENIGFAL